MVTFSRQIVIFYYICISQKTGFNISCKLSPEESIKKTRLFKYIENFASENWQFLDKNSDIFHISAQNIDCGYLLELPQQGGSNEYPLSMFLCRNKKNNIYIPVNPSFTI